MSRPITSRRSQHGGLSSSGTSTGSLRFSATSIGTIDTMSTGADHLLNDLESVPRPSSLDDVRSAPNPASQGDSVKMAIRQSQMRRSMNDGLMRRADAFHLLHNQSYNAIAQARERNQSRMRESQRANETFSLTGTMPAPMQEGADAFLGRIEQSSGQLNNFQVGSLPEGLADAAFQSGPAAQLQQAQNNQLSAQGPGAPQSMVSSDVAGMLSGGLGMQQQQLMGGLNVPISANPNAGGLVSAQALLTMQEHALAQQQQSAAGINALLANLLTPEAQQSPNWAAQVQQAHNLITQQQHQLQRGPKIVYMQGSPHNNLQSMQQRQHPTVFTHNGPQPMQQYQQPHEVVSDSQGSNDIFAEYSDLVPVSAPAERDATAEPVHPRPQRGRADKQRRPAAAPGPAK